MTFWQCHTLFMSPSMYTQPTVATTVNGLKCEKYPSGKKNTDVVQTLFFLYLQIKRGGTQDCNHVWSVRITFKFQYTLAFAMWDSNLTKASPLHLFASLLQTLQAFGELISVVSNVSCQWDGLIDWIKTRQHTSYAFSTLTLSWMLTLMSEFSNLNIKK